MKKSLLPLTDPKVLVTDNGEIKTPKYVPGIPRQYRLNLSGPSGKFNLNGEQDLTKKGQAFSFIPIAYRIFEDALFNRPRMMWVEIYFINEAGQIGMFMLNRYSAENFRFTLADALFYGEKEIGQLIFKAVLKEKQGQEGAYYMAFFEAEALTKEQTQILKHAIEPLAPFHRRDTITGNAEELQSLNWQSPFAPDTEKLEAEAAKENEAEIPEQAA